MYMNTMYTNVVIVTDNSNIAGKLAIKSVEMETARRSEQINVVQMRLKMLGLSEKRDGHVLFILG